jgi:hypothetical protein
MDHTIHVHFLVNYSFGLHNIYFDWIFIKGYVKKPLLIQSEWQMSPLSGIIEQGPVVQKKFFH